MVSVTGTQTSNFIIAQDEAISNCCSYTQGELIHLALDFFFPMCRKLSLTCGG